MEENFANDDLIVKAVVVVGDTEEEKKNRFEYFYVGCCNTFAVAALDMTDLLLGIVLVYLQT